MLSTRTFVLGIVAIMVLVVGAYIIIAPQAEETAEMGTVPTADERAEATALPASVSSDEVIENKTSDVQDAVKAVGEQVVDDATVATPVTSPATITPTEDSVPTPVPSGYTLADVALHADATS